MVFERFVGSCWRWTINCKRIINVYSIGNRGIKGELFWICLGKNKYWFFIYNFLKFW